MAAGDLALNLILRATDQTHGVVGEVSKELGGLGGPLSAVAGLAAVAGAGMVGLAAISIKAAGDLEKSVTQLVTTANEDAKNVGLVTEGIKKMAVETATSTDQLAKGMYVIESAGYHGAAGLQVLKAAAEGAKTENADLGIVTKTLASVMNDYKMSGGQATSAMDGLIKAVSLGNTNLQTLSLAMGNVLPIAASLHVSFPQVAGALSIMTNAGMTAQRASMNLAFALRALGAPGNKAQDTLQNIGISAEQLHKVLMNQGLPAALQMIEDHLYKKFPKGSAAAVDAYKTIMGGAAGYNVALMIANGNLGTYEGNINAIAKAMKNAGGSVEGFELAQQNFNFKMDQAKQAVEVFLITIGTQLLPLAGKVVGWFTNVVQWLTQYENKTHIAEQASKLFVQGIQQIISWFQQLVAKGAQIVQFFRNNELAMNALKGIAIGLFAVIVAGFIGWAIAAAGAAAASIAAAAPFILLGTAVAAVATLFLHFYQTSPQFKAFIDGLIQWLRGAWTAIQQNFLPTIQKIGQFFMTYVWPILVQLGQYIGKQFQPIWQDLVNTFNTQVKPAWDQFVKALQPALPGLQFIGMIILGVVVAALVIFAGLLVGLAKGLAGFLAGVIKVFGGIAETVSGAMQMAAGAVAFFTDLFQGKWDKLVPDIELIWNGLLMTWKGLWDAFLGILQTFWYTISGIFTGIWDTVVGVFTQIYNDLVGHSIVPDIVNGIINWFNKLPDFVKGLITNIANLFTTGWNNIFNSLKTAWTNASTFLGTVWATYVQPKLNTLMTNLTNWGTTLKTNFGTWAKNALDWFTTQINNAIPNIKTAITNIANTIFNILGIPAPNSAPKAGPLSTMGNWMPNMIQTLVNGITNNQPKVTTATNNLANTITMAFNKMNTNVSNNVNGINSKIQLLNTTVQTQTGNVNSQFALLSANISTATSNINSQVSNLNTNVQQGMQQVGTSSQQASSQVSSASSQIGSSSQQAAAQVAQASSTMQTHFGNTSQYATQTVQAVSQAGQQANQQWSRAMSEIHGAYDQAAKALIAESQGDGEKAGHAFYDGFNHLAEAAKAAAAAAANYIASLLGHSTPKEGPLKEDDQWGKHMVQNIIGGMTDMIPGVADAAYSVSQAIADNMNMQPNGKIQLNADLLTNSNPSATSNKPMVITVHLDKKVIAKAVTNYQQTELRVQGAIRGI